MASGPQGQSGASLSDLGVRHHESFGTDGKMDAIIVVNESRALKIFCSLFYVSECAKS